MKLRRFSATHDDAPDRGKPEQQRVCPECGLLISVRARTCLHCGADVAAIEAAAAAEQARLKREQREEAAQRPIRTFVIVLTMIVVVAILAIVVQGSREAARLALTPTVTPTFTATATSTPTPRPTPTSPNTATPIPPIKYVVKVGDTPGGIADAAGISVELLMSYNNRSVNDFIVVGETLLIPVPTPDPTATPTPEGFVASPTPISPTPCEVIYVVQPGDTLSDIAVKMKVSMSTIQSRNNIVDPESIQANQQLVIPTCSTPTVTPSPAGGRPTPTPVPTYPPVKLLHPLDGEIVVGNSSPVLLQWLSSGILRSTELYKVEVTQVNGVQPAQSIRTLATSWRVPQSMFPAVSDRNRTFKWKVWIIRQIGTGSDGAPIYNTVSPISEYTFEWLASPPTPTPTSTPLPGLRPTP